MSSITLTGPMKKVGNSFALFIPADKVREGRFREGDMVRASIASAAPPALGLLRDLPYRPWGKQDKEWLYPRNPGEE